MTLSKDAFHLRKLACVVAVVWREKQGRQHVTRRETLAANRPFVWRHVTRAINSGGQWGDNGGRWGARVAAGARRFLVFSLVLDNTEVCAL